MQKKSSYKIILVLALVAIIGSMLWFSAAPVSALTIGVGSPTPSSPSAGSSASFSVTLSVSSQDVLPVSTVQMDIYNISNAAFRDTFANLPLNNTTSSVTKTSTTNASHTMSVSATGSNWGSGTANRYGYGTLDTGTTGNYSFGNSFGYGYSVGGVHNGNASLTYTAVWNVPAEFPAGTYKAEIRVNAGSVTGTDYTFLNSSTNFTVNSTGGTPTITSISSSTGYSGTTIYVYGTNLSTITTIYFGGTAATSTVVNTSTQVTAVVGAGSTGNVSGYSSTYGTVSSTVYFTYTSSSSNVVISDISINSGGYGTSVNIYGSNLSYLSTVYFGGTPAQSTIVNSSTQITAVVGYGSTGYVTGYSSTYGNITSSVYFYYTGSTSGASINSISTNSGGYGSIVYIYGNNLSTVSTVYFGNTPAISTVVNSSTQVTATVGNGSSGYVTAYSPSLGTINSTVYFTYGGGSTSGATISSLSVNSGGYGTTVYIYGTNLYGITTVYFGGTAAQSTLVNSSTQITAVVGNGTTGYVTAYSSTYGTISSNLYFSYTGASSTAPAITSFTPTTGSSGNTVVIGGTNLSNATAVSFGGVAAQSFSVNSDTQITAIVGIGASGTVSVTNAYGTGTLGGFVYGTSASTTSLSGKVDAAGKFNTNVTANSSDNKALVTIPSGVTGKLGGAALTQITIEQTDAVSVPPPPTYSSYVSHTYNIGPNGATFDKQVSVALIYDPLLIPSGVSESSLFVSWWDAAGNKWNSLPGTVDTVNKKITALTDHFTYFTVIGSTQKAQFGVSDLQVSPKQVQAGKEVTITVILGNGGLVSGSYDVKLIINGKEAATKRVENMPGGATQKLTFTTTQNTPGAYTAEVEYLSGTFTVTPAATTPAVTTPAVTTPAVTTPAATTVKPTTATTTPSATAKPSPTPTATDEGKSGGVNLWLIGGVVIIFLIIVWIVYRVILYQRRSINK